MTTLNTSIPLAQRLANVKADRRYRNYSSGLEAGGNCFKRPCVWFCNVDDIESHGWRFKGYADEIAGLRHTGWYADHDCNETIRGIVVQLPARGGQCVYLAGFAASDADTACIFHDSYDDEHDAAHAADHDAERYAEDAKDGDAEFRAEQEIDDRQQECNRLRAEIPALRAELHAVYVCGHKLAASELRLKIHANISEIRRHEKRIAALHDNHYLAVA